jgi:hypothetical protein
VKVNFVQDDLTHLRHVYETFDLLVDYGTLDDLSPRKRDLYLQNVLPLTHSRSLFVLYVFEWALRWWERPMNIAIEPGEINLRFGTNFDIECYTRNSNGSGWPAGEAVYLMTKK